MIANNYLLKKISEERENNFDLLWENIQDGKWNYLGRKDEVILSGPEKIDLQARHYFQILAKSFIISGQIIQLLADSSIREILQYGASRLIGSIRRSVQTIMKIAPPGRVKKLTIDQSSDVSDAVLLIYVHMIGVIDAFSIAFWRKSTDRLSVRERDADLLRKKYRNKLNISGLNEIFQENEKWISRIKEDFRNRYVHRIPPYVPDARFTNEESRRFADLERRKFSLISSGDLDGAEKLRAEQDLIGKFWPVLAFTDMESIVHLHPTIPDDTFRFNCLVFDLLEVAIPFFSTPNSSDLAP